MDAARILGESISTFFPIVSNGNNKLQKLTIMIDKSVPALSIAGCANSGKKKKGGSNTFTKLMEKLKPDYADFWSAYSVQDVKKFT
eukprot:8002508-Ditylum_brightwellii.AAC.1